MKFKIPSSEGTRWNGPFIVCLLAIFVAAGIAISSVPGVVSAIFSPPPNNQTEAALNELLEKHEAVAKVGRDRFVGRSPFFVPKRPPERPRTRPVVKEPTDISEPVKETPPPGPPSSYSGPKPTSMLGEDVFFRTADAWIKVGDEKNGVLVIRIKDPWTVTLGHKGGEYDVALWGERLDEFFTIKYNGTNRSEGIVEDKRSEATLPTPPRESARDSGRGDDPQSEYNSNIPIPNALSDQKIASMSRKESSDALKGVMAAMRRSDLDEETQKRLEHELEELRSRVRTAS